MVETIMFTHNDLDGIGCGVIHKAVFGKDAETYYCGYHNVDEVIAKTLENVKEQYTAGFPKIIISDLGITPETAKLVDNYQGEKVLLDHHKTNLWIAEQYDWATVDLEASGTLLVYEHLNIDEEYRDFAIHVDDYDRWIHSLPKSKELNRLYYLIGIDRFEERFLTNPQIKFTEAERLLLDLEEENIEHYTNKVEKGLKVYELSDEKRFAIGFAERYQSEVAHELIQRLELDAIALIDVNYKKISFRSKPNFDVGAIAKGLGGGGHKNASGVNFAYKDISDFHGNKYPLIGVLNSLNDMTFELFWRFNRIYESTEYAELEKVFIGERGEN
ncbi:DHH family phosphoesterase [Bacillus andreraoultii]|uniref:DHH family phosphoesterase n=1 Tax=Bacillus andreraoultii TaxID=1499685 RepID=UPI0005397E8D|nr:DHHA1 domain-containing protein [Bacillus andreraoultii]